MDTGTCPEEPPIGTWAEVMILTFLFAVVMYSDRRPASAAPCAAPRPRQAADSVASRASSRDRV